MSLVELRERRGRLGPLRRLKNTVLPNGDHPRRLRLGPARGAVFLTDFRCHTRLYLGLYELELNRWFRKLCIPGSRCFDVGADRGYTALVLAGMGASRVLSFEADPNAFAAARRVLALNTHLDAELEVRLGFVGLQRDPGYGVISLDEAAFSSDGFVPDLIKVDVEGAEADVLCGSKRLLAGRKPHWVVETHGVGLERDCLDLLIDAGYVTHIVTPRRWLPDDRPAVFNRWIVAVSPGDLSDGTDC